MITRRQFLALAGATTCGGILKACGPHACIEPPLKQLNIYSWPDYIQEGAIPEFEKRYGIKVVYDTVSSNEGLIAKLQAGATNYDIIVPSNYAVTKLRKMRLLQPIQYDRLKNFHNLMPRFRDEKTSNRAFAVPYTFGTTGIAFNTAAISARKEYPNDWNAFWDKRFAGRITLLEDARESLGMALKHREHSYNCVDRRLVQEACDDLKAQKEMVMCYTSDQVITSLSTGDSHLSLAYSGDAQQASRANKAVKYVIPTSGCSMWTDNMCIPSGAPHVEAAHLWIDYMLEAKVSAALSNFTLYATPNQAAIEFVDDELKHNPQLYPPDQMLARCEEIDDIGSAIFIYDRLWSELKCS